jgi:outer membrane murein-binding lipoprotein Lpp
VKQAFRIQVSVVLVVLGGLWFGGCDRARTNEALADGTNPANEVDVLINDYEKVANQYVRAARKLQGGDMSVTIPYIELGKETREYSAKLQQISAKMTPQQAQRVASISAKAAPYLQI